MFKIVPTKQFQKDLVKAHKRGKELPKIEKVIDALARKKSLPLKYRDHALVGNYSNHRECHIEPDWLLIYRVDEQAQELILVLVRTGNHSDLFK
jgi:mRNA interferase YafQ